MSQLSGQSGLELKLRPRHVLLVRVCAFVAILIGLLTLSGWILDIDSLKRLSPNLATMKVNTALCFIITGCSLCLASFKSQGASRWVAQICGGVVALLATVTLGQDIIGHSAGIDQLFHLDRATDPNLAPPGRMSPATAGCFFLIGASLVVIEFRTRVTIIVAQVLATLASSIAMLALIGYAYGFEALYKVLPYSSMALHTAVSFVVVSLGVMTLQCTVGISGAFNDRSLGGRIARELLPLVAGTVFIGGMIRVWGEREGYYDSEFGTAAFTAMQFFLLMGIIGAYAIIIGRIDRQREAARAAERREREKFRTTLASIGDGVIATDADQRIIFANPVAETLTGWTMEHAQGRSIEQMFRIIEESTGDPAKQPVGQAVTSNEIVEWMNHTALLARDNTERPIEFTASPIHDDRGRIDGSVLVFRDVTERRRADKVRQNLAAIVTGSHDAIIGKDMEGTITSWNSSAERLYGFSAAEAIGRSIGLIIPEMRAEEFWQIMAALRRGEAIENTETVRQRKDGSLVEISLSVSPIKDVSGKLIGAAAIARDISEQKRIEQELLDLNAGLENRVADRTAQLHDLAQQLSIAEHRERRRIAHRLHEDFQQTLVAGKMAMERLRRRDGDDELKQNAINMLDMAIAASRDLAVELHPPVLYEQGLPAAIAWLREFFLHNHELSVVMAIDEQADPISDEMKSLLFQSARELLMNVVKHAQTHDAGLRLKRVNRDIQIEVEDHGVGIDLDKVRQTQDANGNFGLFGIEQRVRLLGGRLEIQDNGGCRVLLVVPDQSSGKRSTSQQTGEWEEA